MIRDIVCFLMGFASTFVFIYCAITYQEWKHDKLIREGANESGK